MPLRYAAPLLVLALGLGWAAPALAQPAPVGAEERAAVIDRIDALLRERYVFADVGTEAGAFLREQLEADAYADATVPDSFAAALTRDLYAVTRDGHLRVRYRPPMPAGS
ncbi:MAG: hypothetical protein R3362_05375, partial [Rhodothermales bacterium]|nr:hypothetical protein [Rhodothermales bacterium]